MTSLLFLPLRWGRFLGERGMAGHSKWANIKHQKAATDKKRAMLFLKLLREIKSAMRVGGSNLESNPRLATAIQNARLNSVPKQKILSAMSPDAAEATELTFEVVGPGGVGLLIEAEAENRLHVVPAIRRVATKSNCSVGNAGSVSWMFEKKGLVFVDAVDLSKLAIDPEDIAIDIGAEDLHADGEEVTSKGIEPVNAEILFVPKVYATCSEKQADAARLIISKFEELEQVTRVSTNLPQS